MAVTDVWLNVIYIIREERLFKYAQCITSENIITKNGWSTFKIWFNMMYL